MQSRSAAILIAIALLFIGAARIAFVAGHSPMAGYANQFDMARTSACVGLWPDLPAPARYAAHRAAPVSRYIEDAAEGDKCSMSTEVLFAAAGIATWKLAVKAGIADPVRMDLRIVGAIKAGLLVLLAVLFTVALRLRPAWMLAHAAVFAMVLADPFVTLWCNALYTAAKD